MKSVLEAARSIFRRQANFQLSEPTVGPLDSTSSSGERGEAVVAAPIDRRFAAILYADIADYTRLTEQDEEGTHLRLVECMTALRSQIDAHGGRVAHSAGDAILAEFESADSALHCAVAVQLATPEWNRGYDAAHEIGFRIGVNIGKVIESDGDIYGKAVNLAARLESLACSGGICVSEAVREEIGESSTFKLVARGEQYVKNIRNPVPIFCIEIDANRVVDVDRSSRVKIATATT